MPRNNLGTYTLPQAPFVPGTVISSSAVNSNFTDIASALTGSVASNGVTAITGQLRSSVVAAPSFTSTADTTTGFGVSALNTASIWVAGSIVANFTTGTISFTGNTTVTGNMTVTGSITGASFAFTGTGAIQIPAGTTGQRPTPLQGQVRYNQTTGSFEGYDGTEWQSMSAIPSRFTINASVAGGILTVAIKNALTGTDPSVADPIAIKINQGNGIYNPILVNAPLSINTNAIGATLGTQNNVPFRFWLAAFENALAGVTLALINCFNGTAITPLNEEVGHNAVGISAAATSAGIYYCPNGQTLTNKPMTVLGYVEFSNGLAAAGNYTINPSLVQLYRFGIKKPGDTVQVASISTNAGGSGSVGVTITPTSSCNPVLINAMQNVGPASGLSITPQLARGATHIGQPTSFGFSGATTGFGSCSFTLLDTPFTAAGTTYSVISTGGSGTFNGGTMTVQELMG